MNKTKINTILSAVSAGGSIVLNILASLLAAVMILYSGYVLYDSFYTEQKALSAWDLMQYKPEVIMDGDVPLASFESLSTINEDVTGWLTIYDTNIDYPVMQGANDLTYSSRDIFGKSSLTGSLYLTCENNKDFSDPYNLIYGHHMDNGAMFGDLDKFADAEFFDSHKEGLLLTPNAVYDLRIFAVMTTNAYENMVYAAQEKNQTGTGPLVAFVSERAMYMDEQPDGQILAMSTCADTETDGRLVVFASMTPRAEDAVSPTIAKNHDAEKPNVTSEDPESSPDNHANKKLNTVTENIDDAPMPLASWVRSAFSPKGNRTEGSWALLNLLCVVMTVYILVPIHRLCAKYGRKRQMQLANEAGKTLRSEWEEKINEIPPSNPLRAMLDRDLNNDDTYNTRRFTMKFWVGVICELLVSVGAIVVFLLTENMRLPMGVIDQWTLIMLILSLMGWVVDVVLMRNRDAYLARRFKATDQ